MAATPKEEDGCLELTAIDANWVYADSKPSNWPAIPRLMSIEFHPGAIDDELIVLQRKAGGVQRFHVKCENLYDQRIKYFHGSRVMPYIDYDNSTLSAGHMVVIELWRE